MKLFMKIFVFISIGGLIFFETLNILSPKHISGIQNMDMFYSLTDNSVDVIMLGSSRQFVSIDPALLYKERGIAAFTLGGADQPLWNSYYFLKEALKSQKPKLVALEVSSCAMGEYGIYGYVLYNVSGIKSPVNRLEAVMASVQSEQWIPYFLAFPVYHDRYSTLTQEDFLKYRGRKELEYYLGHNTHYQTVPIEKPEIEESVAKISLPEKSEKYLKRIIELCEENDVELFFFVSPEEDYPLLSGCLESIKTIADNNNIMYIDFNKHYEEMRLDFSKDFASGLHLNQNGCPKYSKYFTECLDNIYNLPDRRGDSEYKLWEDAVKFSEQSVIDYEMGQQMTFEEHVSSIFRNNKHMIDFIWTTDDLSEDFSSYLSSIGIDQELSLYTFEGMQYRPVDVTKNLYMDFGMDVYTLNSQGADCNTEKLFDEEGNVASMTFDTYSMKLIDVCIYDENGNAVERPVTIYLNAILTGG